MKQKNIFVIICIYNESKYLETFLKQLANVTSKIIIVDDGSVDSSKQIAKKFSKHVLVHAVNLGKGAAMKTGADYAFNKLGADSVVFMDGDNQHDTDDLHAFFSHLQSKNSPSMLFGVRELSDMPKDRVTANRLCSLVIKLLFGEYIPDVPSGYKALDNQAYQKLAWQSTDYGVELEIACKTAKYKLPFTTVPVKTIYHDLDRGMSILDTLKISYKIFLWRISL